MSYVILSEVRSWLDADDLSSVLTAATNAPVANLRNSSMLSYWRDTSGAVGGGFTWDTNNVSESVWAVVAAGLNQNPATGSDCSFDIELSTSTTWDTLNVVASAVIWKMAPETMWGLAATADRERFDGMMCIGIDTLDSGPSVTGVPIPTAHKSGRVQWRGPVVSAGYHEAAYLALGKNPLLFPAPSAMSRRTIELTRGVGWEVTIGWRYLPEDNVVTGGNTFRGGREMDAFVARNIDRPIIALLDLTGLDATGSPNNSEAAPWGRLGLAKIVSRNPSSYVGPVGAETRNYEDNLTLRTWGAMPRER